MRHSLRCLSSLFVLCVAFATAACGPKRLPATTVTELMEDRVALDGALLKCNQGVAASIDPVECSNARIAVERLAQQADPLEEAKRNADFEHSRERLRMAQERAREEREARARVDPYDLPVVPVDPPPAPAPVPAPMTAPAPVPVPPSAAPPAGAGNAASPLTGQAQH